MHRSKVSNTILRDLFLLELLLSQILESLIDCGCGYCCVVDNDSFINEQIIFHMTHACFPIERLLITVILSYSLLFNKDYPSLRNKDIISNCLIRISNLLSLIIASSGIENIYGIMWS